MTTDFTVTMSMAAGDDIVYCSTRPTVSSDDAGSSTYVAAPD